MKIQPLFTVTVEVDGDLFLKCKINKHEMVLHSLFGVIKVSVSLKITNLYFQACAHTSVVRSCLVVTARTSVLKKGVNKVSNQIWDLRASGRLEHARQTV